MCLKLTIAYLAALQGTSRSAYVARRAEAKCRKNIVPGSHVGICASFGKTSNKGVYSWASKAKPSIPRSRVDRYLSLLRATSSPYVTLITEEPRVLPCR